MCGGNLLNKKSKKKVHWYFRKFHSLSHETFKYIFAQMRTEKKLVSTLTPASLGYNILSCFWTMSEAQVSAYFTSASICPSRADGDRKIYMKNTSDRKMSTIQAANADSFNDILTHVSTVNISRICWNLFDFKCVAGFR